MLLIKIKNNIRIELYNSKGLKIYVKKKNKWFCFLFNNIEAELLKSAINYLLED